MPLADGPMLKLFWVDFVPQPKPRQGGSDKVTSR